MRTLEFYLFACICSRRFTTYQGPFSSSWFNRWKSFRSIQGVRAIWPISDAKKKTVSFDVIVDLFIFSEWFFFSHFFGIHNSIATTDFTIFLVQYCGAGWWCKENCVRPKCRLSFMEHYIHFLPILMNNTEHTQRRHSKRQMASKKKKNSIWCVTCVLNSLLLNSPNLSSSLATMGSGIAHWPHFHTLFSI